MKTERFDELVKEIREASMDTLTKKNANYASSEDRLHNFKVGAAITGGTPAQAALGYMAKHLASLQDKVVRNDFRDREDLKEKIQDSINYLVFIWCCANEEMEKYVSESVQESLHLASPIPCEMSNLGTYTTYAGDSGVTWATGRANTGKETTHEKESTARP